MAEVRSSGPQMAQLVVYTQTLTSFYPAIIINVDRSNGNARLTTFPAGGTTGDQLNVPYDATGNVANTWRYPDSGTGI